MAGRVSLGGNEMDLQEAITELEGQLQIARAAAALPIANQLNATIRDMAQEPRPTFDLVSSIAAFDGEKPEAVTQLFESIDEVAALSNWGDEEKLRVVKLKLSGAALKFVRSEDQARVASYDDMKRVLQDRFSDKAPQHCYFQQLAVIQQRRGETIEAFADRVRCLNEKTIRVTANPEVNVALREEADRRALDAFLRGMVGTVGEQTRLAFPTTMREAITRAIAIEYVTKQNSATIERKVFQTEVITCYRCHEKGHISRDCTNGEMTTSKVTCWRCRKPGHVQRDCRARLTPQRNSQPGRSGNGSGAGGVAATQPPRQ